MLPLDSLAAQICRKQRGHQGSRCMFNLITLSMVCFQLGTLIQEANLQLVYVAGGFQWNCSVMYFKLLPTLIKVSAHEQDNRLSVDYKIQLQRKGTSERAAQLVSVAHSRIDASNRWMEVRCSERSPRRPPRHGRLTVILRPAAVATHRSKKECNMSLNFRKSPQQATHCIQAHLSPQQ